MRNIRWESSSFPAGTYSATTAIPAIPLGDIEIDNKLHNWHIDKAKVRALAQEHGLLLTQVSDAHRLADIGTNYVEVDLEEFYSLGIFVEGWDQLQ